MQYYKCSHCKNAGGVCQMLIAPGVYNLETLELTLNRALGYSRQRNKNIQVKMDFDCLGFEEKEATYNAE